MNENAVGGLSLAAVAGDRVAMIDVRPFIDVKLDPASGVRADSDFATVVDLLDGAKLAIGDMKFS